MVLSTARRGTQRLLRRELLRAGGTEARGTLLCARAAGAFSITGARSRAEQSGAIASTWSGNSEGQQRRYGGGARRGHAPGALAPAAGGCVRSSDWHRSLLTVGLLGWLNGLGMAVAQRARRRPRARWPRNRSASSRQPIARSYLASFVGYVRWAGLARVGH